MEIKVLVCGDTHIPERARRIPDAMARIIDEHRPYDLILFTGDLTCEGMLEWVYRQADEAYVVCGNMDYLPLPEVRKVALGRLEVILAHGHQVWPRGHRGKLAAYAARLGGHVLVNGHTHDPFVELREHKGRRVLLVNPGSLTGVWSGGGGSLTPSLMVMTVDYYEVFIEHYELKKGAVRRREYSFSVHDILGSSTP